MQLVGIADVVLRDLKILAHRVGHHRRGVHTLDDLSRCKATDSVIQRLSEAGEGKTAVQFSGLFNVVVRPLLTEEFMACRAMLPDQTRADSMRP